MVGLVVSGYVTCASGEASGFLKHSRKKEHKGRSCLEHLIRESGEERQDRIGID